MPRQTGKGSRQRRASALERKATQHHEFIGEAAPERKEAEARKHEHLDAERNADVVREMASELNELAEERPGLRVPRSLEEGKRLLRDAPGVLREAPERLREKAEERLSSMPPPAQSAVRIARSTASLMLLPMRMTLRVALEVAALPFAVLRVLRHREA